MASITFEGPNPVNLEERSTTVVNISDEAMLMVVQALCELEGYNPELEGPGTFTIRKTVEFWTQKAEYNILRKAKLEVESTVSQQIEPLKSSITIE